MLKIRKGAKTPRGDADLKAAFVEQVGLLLLACKNYDDGKRDAAKFMSVGLRTLLHQTPQSHSLLQQLGLRTGRFSEWPIGGPPSPSAGQSVGLGSGWTLQISGPIDKGPERNLGALSSAVTSSCRLIVQFAGPGGGESVAPLSSYGTEIRRRFDHWWNCEVVRDLKGRTFCRRDLVLEIANTDGGAHVDPGLEERYLEFSRKNSLGWNFSANGKDWQAVPSPHLACMRQIAHEVLITLQRTASWAITDPYTFGDPLAGKDGYALGGIMIETART